MNPEQLLVVTCQYGRINRLSRGERMELNGVLTMAKNMLKNKGRGRGRGKGRGTSAVASGG